VANGSWLSSFGTPKKPRAVDGHTLWPGPAAWLVVTIRRPRQVDYVLVCPKAAPLDWWWTAGPPLGVAAVHTPWPADPRLAPTLWSLSAAGRPVVFIGDMDPVALAQYLAASRMLRERNGPELAYGGMNDSWLAAIRRSVRRSLSAKALCTRLDRAETRLWRRLEADTNVEQLLGPEASDLLRNGYKIELEAASNPAILTPSHKRWVFRHLRSVALAGKARAPQLTLKKSRRTTR
jgi:hypothetical protein